MGSRRRLLIIGLDSASPEYLFGRCLPVMPNFRALLAGARFGPLRTTDPPISLPAWAVLFTGVDPGSLGMYGFRHRLNHSYDKNYGPSSDRLPVPTIWTLLSERGRRVCSIAMPPGYPAPPLNGVSISDFLTPPGAPDWTYPRELASEITRRHGRYRFDVTFRATERDRLYRDLVEMTETRFAVAEELYERERWDVFAIHEVGTDRLHHAYTKSFDPSHPAYVPGNPLEHVLLDYYALLDRSLGRLLAHVDAETVVVVCSDHGSMPMLGGFCINQWLVEEGYLVLRGPVPAAGTPLEKAEVDWARTRVWGAGGYYARLFFNIQGREPQGALRPEEVPTLEQELRARLATLRTTEGRPMVTRVLRPSETYRMVRGDPPDLMLYFDELRWRSAGTLGHPTLYLKENDTGPDDAVHSMEGVLLVRDPAHPGGGALPRQEAVDLAPTLLALLDEPIPDHIQGRPIPELVGTSTERRRGATSVPGTKPT